MIPVPGGIHHTNRDGGRKSAVFDRLWLQWGDMVKYSLLSKYRSQLMGFAMLAVMFYHAGYLELGFLNAPRVLAFGGVDIFVLLSGMGLAMSLTRRRQGYGDFLIRRMGRVLPAYFIVMVPYTLYLFIAHRANLSTFFWNATLLQYWVRPNGHFNWYMTGIMIYYILIPPLTAWLARSHRPVLLTVLGSLVGFGICELLYRDGYWYYMDVFFRIPVLLEGILLGLWICGERQFTRRDGLCWAAVFLGGVGVLALFASGVTEWATYAFAFTTAPVCFVLARLLDRLPQGPVKRALAFVGENSLEIYLLNVSLFSEHQLLRRFFDPGPGHYIYFAVAFALNILLGWGLHKAVGWLKKQIGARKKSNFEIEH